MNEQRETFEETWNRVEAALGGRFRDGSECPGSIVDLYRLALADAGGPCELEDEERLELKEHLYVCPVCRHTYLGALSGARSELQISDEDNAAGAIRDDLFQSFGDEANTSGSLLDEFASAETNVQPVEESEVLLQAWRMAAEEGLQEIGRVVVAERGRMATLGDARLRFQCDGITGGVLKSAADAERKERKFRIQVPLGAHRGEYQRSFILLIDPSEQAGRVWVRATVESADVAAALDGWQLQLQIPDAKKAWRFTGDEAGDFQQEDDKSDRTAFEIPLGRYEIQLQSPEGEQWNAVIRLEQLVEKAASATNYEEP